MSRIELESVDTANMIMTTTSLQRLSSLRLGCAAALFLMLWATPSHAQTVAGMVNGDPITNYDIEQRSKLNFLSTHKPQVRKQVIDELIDEKIKIREGKKYSIDPSSSDIDGLYSGMSSRMHITPDQLTKSLAGSGIRPETLKERMKAEMIWSSLIRGRYKGREALRNRVQTCDEANILFKSMQNAAIRDVVTKTSADLPGPLRELL